MADKFVTIAEYMDSIQAEMARQTLEDFDIKAVVIGENALNTCLAPTVMTAKLQVFESNADEAKQILEEQEQSYEPGESAEFDELGGYEEPEEP
jgi:hypothetical protein